MKESHWNSQGIILEFLKKEKPELRDLIIDLLKSEWEKNGFRNNEYFERPASEKIKLLYYLAKTLDSEQPLRYLMPTVDFSEKYLSINGNNWEEMFENGDLFIFEDSDNKTLKPISIQDIFCSLVQKKEGELTPKQLILTHINRDNLGKPFSSDEESRYLQLLESNFPELYEEYCELQVYMQQIEDELSSDKYDNLFSAIQFMLVLSASPDGVEGSYHEKDALPNLLSTFAYEYLLAVCDETLTASEKALFFSMNIQPRSKPSENVGDLVDRVTHKGLCTTFAGDYWLTLLSQYRPNMTFNFQIPYDIVAEKLGEAYNEDPAQWENLIENFVEDNKKFVARKFFDLVNDDEDLDSSYSNTY